MKNLLLICIGTAWIASGCASYPTALLTEGQIIEAAEDRIFVVFREADQLDKHTGGWFYLPGKGIVDKDHYRVTLVLTPKFTTNE